MNELTEWQCRSVLALLIAGCLPMLALYSVRTFCSCLYLCISGSSLFGKTFPFQGEGRGGAFGLLPGSADDPSVSAFGYLRRAVENGLRLGSIRILSRASLYPDPSGRGSENDIKSGTRTFVKKNGGSVRLLIYLCLGLEGIFLLLLFLWNLKAGWQLALLAVYLLQLCIAGGTIRFLYKENWLTSFLCVPLEDLYNFYLPLILLLALAAGNAAWLLPLLVLLLIGWRPMLEKWKIVIFGITHWKGFRS